MLALPRLGRCAAPTSRSSDRIRSDSAGAWQPTAANDGPAVELQRVPPDGQPFRRSTGCCRRNRHHGHRTTRLLEDRDCARRFEHGQSHAGECHIRDTGGSHVQQCLGRKRLAGHRRRTRTIRRGASARRGGAPCPRVGDSERRQCEQTQGVRRGDWGLAIGGQHDLCIHVFARCPWLSRERPEVLTRRVAPLLRGEASQLSGSLTDLGRSRYFETLAGVLI